MFCVRFHKSVQPGEKKAFCSVEQKMCSFSYVGSRVNIVRFCVSVQIAD